LTDVVREGPLRQAVVFEYPPIGDSGYGDSLTPIPPEHPNFPYGYTLYPA